VVTAAEALNNLRGCQLRGGKTKRGSKRVDAKNKKKGLEDFAEPIIDKGREPSAIPSQRKEP